MNMSSLTDWVSSIATAVATAVATIFLMLQFLGLEGPVRRWFGRPAMPTNGAEVSRREFKARMRSMDRRIDGLRDR
ncbi:hypothetical protein TARUN_2315, partial [Trichoderma arundinaceum]